MELCPGSLPRSQNTIHRLKTVEQIVIFCLLPHRLKVISEVCTVKSRLNLQVYILHQGKEITLRNYNASVRNLLGNPLSNEGKIVLTSCSEMEKERKTKKKVKTDDLTPSNWLMNESTGSKQTLRQQRKT